MPYKDPEARKKYRHDYFKSHYIPHPKKVMTPEERLAANRKAQREFAARNRHSLKFLARKAVANQKEKDPLFQKACELCGNVKSQAHHHKGYAPEFWLDVQWLCKLCHRTAHQ